MFHCLSECATFSDLREQWCRRCSVHPESIPYWVRHPWLFNPTSSFNTLRTVLAMSPSLGKPVSALSLSLSCSYQFLPPSGPAAWLLLAFSSSPARCSSALSMYCSFQLSPRKGLRSVLLSALHNHPSVLPSLAGLPGQGSAARHCRFSGARVRPERLMLCLSSRRSSVQNDRKKCDPTGVVKV